MCCCFACRPVTDVARDARRPDRATRQRAPPCRCARPTISRSPAPATMPPGASRSGRRSIVASRTAIRTIRDSRCSIRRPDCIFSWRAPTETHRHHDGRLHGPVARGRVRSLPLAGSSARRFTSNTRSRRSITSSRSWFPTSEGSSSAGGPGISRASGRRGRRPASSAGRRPQALRSRDGGPSSSFLMR